jgi:nicotinamidase-related amidase
MNTSQSLLEANDSVLIVIDIQDHFLEKLPAPESELLVRRSCWLIAVAQWRGIPLVVTAEEAGGQPVSPRILQSLSPGTAVFDKSSFGLAHQPDILAAVEGTGRRTAVLIGLETDVCVAHSALGLLEKGYRVAVVADATGSPQNGHEIGLARMKNAGVVVVSAKSLFYEWMRSLDWLYRFHSENPDMRDPGGIVL